MPLISVITINYNNAIGLQKTVDSVISQTYKEIEFIVIDGASTDNSKQIIENNLSNISYWVSEKDNGIYDAQNKGILKAKGDYYLFLNSGDVLADKFVLEKIVPFLSSNKSFYYGNLLLLKDNKTEKHLAPKEIELDFLLNSTFWHPCVFIKSDLFKQFGLYNTSFDICGDYEFFIRCLLKPNVTTQYLNEYITLFDGEGISNDATKINVQNKERDLAWKLNVSEIIFDSLKKQNAFSRSKYASMINSLQKIRGKSNF